MLYLCSMDSNLLSNIQKLFYERIEVFSKVEFSKLSIVTGIVKIFLKVSSIKLLRLLNYWKSSELLCMAIASNSFSIWAIFAGPVYSVAKCLP